VKSVLPSNGFVPPCIPTHNEPAEGLWNGACDVWRGDFVDCGGRGGRLVLGDRVMASDVRARAGLSGPQMMQENGTRSRKPSLSRGGLGVPRRSP
jgi:hypothetical protein